METHQTVCIIPARGGSKRIPRKNVKDFLGKPLIAYSIEAALKCGLFDQVVVSTDDAEIAKVSQAFGAKTPFVRPPELSDDFTSSDEVIKHAITWLRDHGHDYKIACALYPTAPLLRPSDLTEGYLKLLKTDAAFAFSVTSFAFPIQRALRLSGAGVAMFQPEHALTRSQDLEPAFHDAGQFYWGWCDSFLNDIGIFSERSVPVFLPRHHVVDIDTPEDWAMAEALYKTLFHK